MTKNKSNKEMANENFYCYSTRLYHFLSSVKFRYISIGINSNTNKKYWVYEKSKNLDSAISIYNIIKHKFS